MNLLVKKDCSMCLDGMDVVLSSGEKREFLIGQLNIPVDLEDGIKLETILHVFYELKDFIYEYFGEKYEMIRALLTVSQTDYNCLRIYKSGNISDGYLYIEPFSDFEEVKNKPQSSTFGDVEVIIDNDLKIINDGGEVKMEVKSVFTLLDLLTSIFESLPEELKEKANFANF